ncbi:hypothetical protein UlMin_011925 [Ulmus minor]
MSNNQNKKSWVWSSKRSAMARKQTTRVTFLFIIFVSLVAFGTFVPIFAPLPPLSSHSHHHHYSHTIPKKATTARKFEIAEDKFWKNGQPFQIIGGDLHYFRIHPEYWEDRLLRAKALGLNTIQTYVPWNLHEPKPGNFVFEGIADLSSLLKLCQKLGFLVMLRAGPYVCGEWDLDGFPPWLLAINPPLRLRSSDPGFLQLVEKWWGTLLPKVVPFLYSNGGPIIMVQVENEYGSFGDNKAYLHHLVRLAKDHLGDDIILYTTDGGTRETLEKGTIRGDALFSAVDFDTGANPWPIFELQKEFNAPGKSPPLSSEFYTGWLTHWGEMIASTNAYSTASALDKILGRNGSAVLYMAHGGTNFGFYNGANTGSDESDYKADLTSYDYDAPIWETGDASNAKFLALRRVVERYSAESLPSVPPDIKKTGYGSVHLIKTGNLLDMLENFEVVKSENPMPMESTGQMFGFLLYATEFASEDNGDGGILSISKVHDRAQVLISCSSDHNSQRPTYVGTIERWSSQSLKLPIIKCDSNINLFILGILSSVNLNSRSLRQWKMYLIPSVNLNEVPKNNPIIQAAYSGLTNLSAHKKIKEKSANISNEPAFYTGQFYIDKEDQIKDIFISFNGWTKGIVTVNNFNLGRFWPSKGPQCHLYVPAPILKQGENVVIVFELESPNPELVVSFVDQQDFTCGSS